MIFFNTKKLTGIMTKEERPAAVGYDCRRAAGVTGETRIFL